MLDLQRSSSVCFYKSDRSKLKELGVKRRESARGGICLAGPRLEEPTVVAEPQRNGAHRCLAQDPELVWEFITGGAGHQRPHLQSCPQSPDDWQKVSFNLITMLTAFIPAGGNVLKSYNPGVRCTRCNTTDMSPDMGIPSARVRRSSGASWFGLGALITRCFIRRCSLDCQ
jgi:hypothetical protein